MTSEPNKDLINAIAIIKDTVLEDFSEKYQLIVLANILLMIAENHLPDHLKDDSQKLLSDGRSVAYEKISHPDNSGLNLAAAAHLIIRQAENV